MQPTVQPFISGLDVVEPEYSASSLSPEEDSRHVERRCHEDPPDIASVDLAAAIQDLTSEPIGGQPSPDHRAPSSAQRAEHEVIEADCCAPGAIAYPREGSRLLDPRKDGQVDGRRLDERPEIISIDPPLGHVDVLRPGFNPSFERGHVGPRIAPFDFRYYERPHLQGGKFRRMPSVGSLLQARPRGADQRNSKITDNAVRSRGRPTASRPTVGRGRRSRAPCGGDRPLRYH